MKDNPGPSLEDKVEFLSRSASYPSHPPTVDVIETHMSWVFLTPDQVFKLKKPIRLPFLDFSTLALRRHNCREEVRLNRALANGVYLGVLPLTLESDGCLALMGSGEVCDWLVHMQRLPQERMLDCLIRQRKVDFPAVQAAALRLAHFYSKARPASYDAEAYIARLQRQLTENETVLTDTLYLMPADSVRELHARQRLFLRQRRGDLEQRVQQRRIIEAHGDLRPEHICLVAPPVIIDRLEFNREFRLLDPLDELAFLAIECEIGGAPAVGEAFLEVYRRETGDAAASELLAFYQCYRACLRAKLAVWHLDDDPRQQRQNWLAKARRYLDRAAFYSQRFLT